jgi:hypothetical protein
MFYSQGPGGRISVGAESRKLDQVHYASPALLGADVD